jgi:hypothetical protein
MAGRGVVASGADDDGDDGAGFAVGLVLANEDGEILALLGFTGHQQGPGVPVGEAHDAHEEHKSRVPIALAIQVDGFGFALGGLKQGASLIERPAAQYRLRTLRGGVAGGDRGRWTRPLP